MQSPEWSDLKDALSAEMSRAISGIGPDRFETLARFALMDRVQGGGRDGAMRCARRLDATRAVAARANRRS